MRPLFLPQEFGSVPFQNVSDYISEMWVCMHNTELSSFRSLRFIFTRVKIWDFYVRTYQFTNAILVSTTFRVQWEIKIFCAEIHVYMHVYEINRITHARLKIYIYFPCWTGHLTRLHALRYPDQLQWVTILVIKFHLLPGFNRFNE